MKLKRVRRYRYATRYIRPILGNNVVLSAGLALPFVIGASTSMNNALALTIAIGIVNIPTMIFASLLGKKIPQWLRLPCYVLLASALVVVSRFAVSWIAPNIFDSLGIYLTLLAVNTILLVRGKQVIPQYNFYRAALDGVVTTVSFGIVMFVVSLCRELVGNNTLWGDAINFPIKLPGALLPAFGFILVGLLAAWAKFFRRLVIRYNLRKDNPPRTAAKLPEGEVE